MSDTEKLVFISTVGLENPEKATLPFVIATAGLTVDAEVVVILQSNAVMLAKNGMANHVNAPGFIPLEKLMQDFIELGGRLLLCSPCLKERNIASEDLIEGSIIVAAATVVDEVLTAKSVITY